MIGKTIAHHEILDKLGEGGMGVVYKAKDTHLDRFVAIKILPPEKVTNANRKARFVQEARSASALNHPNIITIYDIAEVNGVDYMAMEYVSGKTLEQMIPQGGMAPEEVVKHAVQIAGALSTAHQAGIIHRDLKPSNIMVREDGLVKVLDFGLAKLVERSISESDSTLTELVQTGKEEIVGTAAYMSPEQVERRRLDARSDIFSFGAVLYEMLAGRRPFEGHSSVAVMAAVLDKEPKPLGEVAANVPPELVDVVVRCLRKDPGQRYQSAEELKAALEACERGVAKDPATFPSIAVLPFLNMSRDEEDEYFSDGLTEELINALTQVAGLRVVSRTSVFRYKGAAEDICDVGQKLRAAKVLEGSVRRAGSRVRVTAQLINVEDGYHIWSQRYDREMKDIFDLQDELARAIVETLEVKLVGEQKQQLVKVHTEKPKAYDLCLKGRHLIYQYTRESLERSIKYFESAQNEDPGCALAYGGAAFANACLAIFGWAPPREVMPIGKQTALAALRIDDTDAEFHRGLAFVRHWYEWDWVGAEKGYRRAVSLQPGDAGTYVQYGEVLTHVGRFDEAIALLGQALKLDPVSPEANRMLGQVLFYARRYDEAIDCLRKAQELAPAYWVLEFYLGEVYSAKGQYTDALQAAEQALSLAPAEPLCLALFGYVNAKIGRHAEARETLEKFRQWRSRTYFSPVMIHWIHLGLGQNEQALDWLETAVEDRDPLCTVSKVSPFVDPLRSEPRFQKLLRKMGFDAGGDLPPRRHP